MSEHSDENEDLSIPSQTDMDVITLVKKMQQQLNFLEKKIDLLIGQSPSDRPRFSKPPFRPSFGGASSGKRDFHRGPREGGFNRAPVRAQQRGGALPSHCREGEALRSAGAAASASEG